MLENSYHVEKQHSEIVWRSDKEHNKDKFAQRNVHATLKKNNLILLFNTSLQYIFQLSSRWPNLKTNYTKLFHLIYDISTHLQTLARTHAHARACKHTILIKV